MIFFRSKNPIEYYINKLRNLNQDLVVLQKDSTNNNKLNLNIKHVEFITDINILKK